jgi:hypothetical protein
MKSPTGPHGKQDLLHDVSYLQVIVRCRFPEMVPPSPRYLPNCGVIISPRRHLKRQLKPTEAR